MNTAIILAGGSGSRMGTDIPKQFISVREKPVITYCLEIFQKHDEIDAIVVAVSDEWKEFTEKCADEYGIEKIAAYAPAGRTRQHSIYNALKSIDEHLPETDIVIVHDAARPLVSDEIISACIAGAEKYDGAMPVITVKDTVYLSSDGDKIDRLLNRSELFAGQAPESFRFKRYLQIHDEAGDEEIGSTVGSTQIAFRHGMDIHMVKGSERNLKITTIEDLETFETLISD